MSNLPPERPPAPLPNRIPEERVHAALHRAAQLQAEATERLERQARERMQPHAENADQAHGYLRDEVEAAAVEAGISSEYIRLALLEQEALGDDATRLSPWIDRMGSRMLGTRERSIELSRPIDAAPAAVLAAMQRIFPSHPYRMTLVDSVGGLPLEGGVLVFRIPQMSALTTDASTFTYTAWAVDLLQLHVSLHPLERGDGSATVLVLHGDLRTSTRRNVWTGLAFSGAGGGVVDSPPEPPPSPPEQRSRWSRSARWLASPAWGLPPRRATASPTATT